MTSSDIQVLHAHTFDGFEAIDDHSYRLVSHSQGVEFVVDHLRRDRHQLIGELTVRCHLPGARTIDDGILNIGDFNLTSIRSRQERAKYLATRAQTQDDDLDWLGLLEELSQRILAADRAGQPAVSLRDVPRPEPDSTLDVHGLPLLARQA